MENTTNNRKVKGIGLVALSKVKNFYENNKVEIWAYGVIMGAYIAGYYTGRKQCEMNISNYIGTKDEVFYLDKDTNELVAKAVRTVVVRE